MATRSMFFDSQSGDRTYSAAIFSIAMQRSSDNGYVQGFAGELEVTETSPTGMQVEVALGSIWIEGRLLQVYSSAETLSITASDPTDDRIDRIIARVDFSGRTCELVVKDGTASASPSPPSLQRDSTFYEMSLAQVYVSAGATTITNSNITDERDDETLCGKSKHPSVGDAVETLNNHLADMDDPHDTEISASVGSSGWYRIAVNGDPGAGSGGTRASAKFHIRDLTASYHSSITLYASYSDGQNPTLSLINRTFGSNDGRIKEARLISDSANSVGGAALEIRVDGAADLEVTIYDNQYTAGWSSVNFTSGNVPSGYVTTSIDFATNDLVQAVASEGNLNYSLERDGTIRDIKAITAQIERAEASVAFSSGTLTFDSENFDTDGMVDLGTNNDRITIQTPGYYWINGFVNFAEAQESSDEGRIIEIRHRDVSASATNTIHQQFQMANKSQDFSYDETTLTGSVVKYLDVNDYLTLAYDIETGTKDISARLEVYRIGGPIA